MRSALLLAMVGCGVMVAVCGCRTRIRVPDYLPREVMANQVGGAVVYETNDPRRGGGGSYPQPVKTPSPAPATSVTPQPEVRPVAPPAIVPVAPVTAAPADASAPRRTLYGQPEGVSVSGGGLREATITWTAPTDEVYRYRVERAESPAGPFVPVDELAPRKMRYRDTGGGGVPLKDSTTYYYQVVAILDRGGPESIPSAVVKATTAPPPVPPPGVKAMAPSSRAVKVSWAPAPSEDVILYRVERAQAATPAKYEPVGEARTTSLVDGGTAASTLKDSTKYLYRVTTVNRVKAESAPSVPVEVVTLPPPAPVQKLAAASDEVRCVPLTWAPSPEMDVIRYDVYRARLENGPFEKIGSVEGRTLASYLDGGANPGNLEDEAIYFYRIRAVNAVTAESPDPASVRAFTRGVPAEVGVVTAAPNRPREVPVAWTMNPDRAVVGYELWRAEEGTDEWGQVCRLEGRSSTNFLDRGELKPKPGLGSLKDGTVYLYKVISFNKANVRSSASAAASARTKYRPAAPAGLQTSTNLPLSISLSWKPNPETDISDYVIEAANEADGSFSKLVTVPANSAGGLSSREMALESGVARYYRIKAIDKDGLESDWCQPVGGRAKPVPGMPVSVAAQAVGNNVRVGWQAPAQPDVRRYKIWRKKFFGWELISTTEQASYLFEFTEQSKPMTVAVSAVDQDELESQKSESLEIKPGL